MLDKRDIISPLSLLPYDYPALLGFFDRGSRVALLRLLPVSEDSVRSASAVLRLYSRESFSGRSGRGPPPRSQAESVRSTPGTFPAWDRGTWSPVSRRSTIPPPSADKPQP